MMGRRIRHVRVMYAIPLALIVLLLIAYLFFSNNKTAESIIAVLGVGVAGVGMILQYSQTQKLNEGSFMMELNDQFITNPDMIKFEQQFELYLLRYNAVLDEKFDKLSANNSELKKEDVTLDAKEINALEFGLDLHRESEECQQLINYLVYLKSLAVLIEQGVIKNNVAFEMFSYRFFVAVNNPRIQQFEIIPYQDFYKSIYSLSEKWVRRMQRKHSNEKDRLLKEVPLYQFRLTKSHKDDLGKFIKALEPIDEFRARMEPVIKKYKKDDDD